MINTAAQRMFSPRRAREFNERGYVVLDDFIDAQAVHQVTEEVERLEPDECASRRRRGVVFARRNLLQLAFVRALIRRDEIREVLSHSGAGLIPVRAILFDKSPDANWTVPWHQDRSIAVRSRIDLPGFGPWSQKAGVIHVQPPEEILKEMLTFRLHLDACGADNGPLRVIAETHGKVLDPEDIVTIVREREQSRCITGAGGLVLMSPLLLHASSPATTPHHRRVIHIEFGSTRLPGGLEWASA